MENQTIDFIHISLQIKHICLRHLTLNVIWGILDCYLHFVDIVRCVNFTNIVVSCSSHSIYVRTQYYKVWYMNTNILSNLNRHVSFKLSEERETRCTRLFFESRDVYIVSKRAEHNGSKFSFSILFLLSIVGSIRCPFKNCTHFQYQCRHESIFYSLRTDIITLAIFTYFGKL